mgnify:CR=1 FL=1
MGVEPQKNAVIHNGLQALSRLAVHEELLRADRDGDLLLLPVLRQFWKASATTVKAEKERRRRRREKEKA